MLHSYYALSRLDIASQEFVDTVNKINIKLAFNPDTMVKRKDKAAFQRKLKLVVPVEMKIGPFTCDQSLPMTAMALNLNYLVTAALWT